MIKQIIIAVLFSVSVSALAQEWKQENKQTQIVFVIQNFGIDVDGFFRSKEITTNFNTTNLAASFINAKIDVKSIDTGMSSRDKHILKKAYFDVENYESILLKSTKIEKDKTGNIILYADLTIKGVVKQVQIPITVVEDKNSIQISSSFTINRKDFKVSGGGFVLSKLVNVNVGYRGTR